LSLLSAAPDAEFYALARKQFDSAQNMTDSFGALASIVNAEDKELADEVLEKFYERWKYDAQVMEQWFSV
jgi:aminopeptidase N